MIVERKIKEGDIRVYAYVGCFPGGDILLVDPVGKLSIISHRMVTAVAGQEFEEVKNYVESQRPKSSGHETKDHPFGFGVEGASRVEHAAS